MNREWCNRVRALVNERRGKKRWNDLGVHKNSKRDKFQTKRNLKVIAGVKKGGSEWAGTRTDQGLGEKLLGAFASKTDQRRPGKNTMGAGSIERSGRGRGSITK